MDAPSNPHVRAARADLAAHSIQALVIGGSAGSLSALATILPALPADLPLPILIVIHIPPDRRNPLREVLQHRCPLPVAEAVDKQTIDPGAILFAPAGCHLLVERSGTVALSVDEPVHYSRPAIDPLFETAAWTWGRRLLGILLSGASHDGAAGLAAIAAAGGLTWVQAPASADVTLMPTAALRAVPAARSLPPPAMAEALGLFSAPLE